MMLGYIDLSMKLLHYIFSLCISFANLIGKPNDTIRALALVSFQSFDGFLHFLYRKIPLVISIDGGDMASSSGVTVSSFEMSLYSSLQYAVHLCFVSSFSCRIFPFLSLIFLLCWCPLFFLFFKLFINLSAPVFLRISFYFPRLLL